MTLGIEHEEAARLAEELAKLQETSVEEALLNALRRAVARERRRSQKDVIADELMEIGRRYSSLPVFDERSDDEILGWDH